MDDSSLRAVLQAEERSALGYLGGALSEARKKAMDYYFGEPFGNEIEGRSQVVSTDVADTIEWIMPSLMRIFTGGDEVAEYQPSGPEDEESAKQASDFCNWIFLKDNPGFVSLHSAIKDALLLKTGILKCWWDPTPAYREQTYSSLPMDSFSLLKEHEAAGKIEIVSVEESTDGMEPTVDVKIRKTRYNGRTCIEAVPPDEFLISRRAREVKDATYVAHRRLRTQSSLIEDGFDKSVVETLASEYEDRTGEQAQRYQDIDERRIGSPSDSTDKSTREIWVTESYILIDYDGDGVAERRKVTHAGSSATLLTRDGEPDNERWEGPVPFCVLSPILMPHRVIGRSMADLVIDLQLIKSTILRQILDNLYLANNSRHVISDQVNLDDLLTTRPGGIVRLKEGAKPAEGHVMPLVTPLVAAQAFPMLEYIDSIKENRTGTTKYNQGLDADTLNKTAHGISQIMTAAQQRTELIARVFAETGIKHLFKLILWNVCRYQDKPRVIKLRNQWVPMDPTEWDEQMDVSINVGLGTGNRDQVLAHLNLIGQAQQQIGAAQGGMSGPIVTAENVYNLSKKVTENAGFKNSELFFTDPKNAPPQPPPPPDPRIAAAQAQVQIKQQAAQQDAALDQQRAQQDAQMAQQELVAEIGLQKAKLEAQFQAQNAAMVAEQNLAQQRVAFEHELAMRKLESDAAIKAYTARANAEIAARSAANRPQVGQ